MSNNEKRINEIDNRLKSVEQYIDGLDKMSRQISDFVKAHHVNPSKEQKGDVRTLKD